MAGEEPELHGLRVDDDGEGRRGGAPRAARDGDGEGEAAGRGTVWGEAAATARAISSSLGRAARRSWARAAHSRPAAERLGGEVASAEASMAAAWRRSAISSRVNEGGGRGRNA